MPADVKRKGELVEGFRILDELGQGAASVIYVVHDPKNKHVWALKHVVKTNPKDQRFLDQAEQEYSIASKLDHPALRKIERVIRKKESLLGGTSELYLVMELVDGISCQDRPPTTFEDAVWIFEQTANGLDYMHGEGFVHADMKPNNIIAVLNDDGQPEVKIIDLGQSCKIGTVKERIQGTPEYIAPEQVHRRAITPKTDVYNLGAAMYWILTRQFVPSALGTEDSLISSIDDSMIPRAKPVQELNPKIPDKLAELIMQCIQIDPEARPTMGQVADRLNMIRARLLADATTRKNGKRTIDGNGTRVPDGPGGSKSGSRGLSDSKNPAGSNGPSNGSTNGSTPPKVKNVPPPPIDPGPGLADADDGGHSHPPDHSGKK